MNETLLELSALAPELEDAFGDPRAIDEWFVRLLHGSLVATAIGRYEPFGAIAASALDDLAARRSIDLDPARRDRIVSDIRRLPAHAEAGGALDRLREAGFRLTAFTNSPNEVAIEQLGHAGLLDRFDEVCSVDLAGRFKPHPEGYLAVADALEVPVERIRLVAAHDWDVAGAIAAGARGAFVARPGSTYRSWLPKPDIEGADLMEVAERIVAVDGTGAASGAVAP